MFLGEVASILEKIYPGIAFIKVNPWIDGDYVFYGDKEGIYLHWFIKYCCNEMQDIIFFFVLAKAAYQFSFKLFLISWVFFGYHVIDAFMLLYNYKTSHWIYWLLNGCIVIGVVLIIRPEKKQGKLRSIS
jgi:hypothetical protein